MCTAGGRSSITRMKYSTSPIDAQAVAIGQPDAIGVVFCEHQLGGRPIAVRRQRTGGAPDSRELAGRQRLVGVDRRPHPGSRRRVDVAAILVLARREPRERRIVVADVDGLHARRKQRRHRVGVRRGAARDDPVLEAAIDRFEGVAEGAAGGAIGTVRCWPFADTTSEGDDRQQSRAAPVHRARDAERPAGGHAHVAGQHLDADAARKRRDPDRRAGAQPAAVPIATSASVRSATPPAACTAARRSEAGEITAAGSISRSSPTALTRPAAPRTRRMPIGRLQHLDGADERIAERPGSDLRRRCCSSTKRATRQSSGRRGIRRTTRTTAAAATAHAMAENGNEPPAGRRRGPDDRCRAGERKSPPRPSPAPIAVSAVEAEPAAPDRASSDRSSSCLRPASTLRLRSARHAERPSDDRLGDERRQHQQQPVPPQILPCLRPAARLQRSPARPAPRRGWSRASARTRRRSAPPRCSPAGSTLTATAPAGDRIDARFRPAPAGASATRYSRRRSLERRPHDEPLSMTNGTNAGFSGNSFQRRSRSDANSITRPFPSRRSSSAGDPSVNRAATSHPSGRTFQVRSNRT